MGWAVVATRFSALPAPVRVGLWVVVALAGWVPFVGTTLSPDEAGLLMVGGQWAPGSSLYGDYWVDRPPLLIALFAAADVAGGATAVRVLGLVAVATTVVATHLLTRAVAPGRSPDAVTAVVALALASPLLGGAGAVNAEMLAVPLVLLGLLCVVRALRTGGAQALALGAAGGALGAGAVLVKQNFVDVLVFLVALLLVVARRRDPAAGRRRPVLVVVGAAAAGAVIATALVLAAAAARGVDLGDLWDALVVFRVEAARVVGASASVDTPVRLARLVGALVLSGLPVLVGVLLLGWRRPVAGRRARGDGLGPLPVDLRLPAVAVLAWEVVGIAGGGSYWLHYLVGLLPGIVLVAAVSLDRGAGGRAVRWAVAACAASSVVALLVVLVAPQPRAAEPAIDYLRAHAGPGDTAVVAFGSANILQESGMRSPYPYLWSLPVRVHDSELATLIDVLEDDRPDWVVVAGESLASWAIESDAAEAVLAEHYERRAAAGTFTVFRRAVP